MYQAISIQSFFEEIKSRAVSDAVNCHVSFQMTLAQSEGLYMYVDQLRIKYLIMKLLSVIFQCSKPNDSIVVTVAIASLFAGKGKILVQMHHTGNEDSHRRLQRQLDWYNGQSDFYGVKLEDEQNTMLFRFHDEGKNQLCLEVKFDADMSENCYDMESYQTEEKSMIAPFHMEYENKRILIVEDDEISQKALEITLEQLGMQVVSADNGRNAVSCVENSKLDSIHMIFMDLQLPLLDGITATKQIRSLHRMDAKTIPIIATTASMDQEELQEALDAGMNGLLLKPYDQTKILSLLQQYWK